MQFKYIDGMDLANLNGLDQKIMEQQEVWTLNAVMDCAKQDLDTAAKLFGSTKDTLIERLKKHKLMREASELLPFFSFNLDKNQDSPV